MRVPTYLWLALVAVSWVLCLHPAAARDGDPHSHTYRPRDVVNILSEYSSLVNMSTQSMISSNGYIAEALRVPTEDGYILEVHRIPCGATTCAPPVGGSRPVVLLHHCLLCSSSDFIMNTPDKALAYLLADAGYDVWLTNARGNTYSKGHISLSPEEEEFWEFSWHEMGMYDVPAVIDFALSTTGQSQLDYVGFSMGSTVFWAMLSERPHYADKVRLMVALGPVAFVNHIQGPMRFAAPFVDVIERSLSLLGQYEMLSFGPTMDKLLATFCDERLFTSHICQNLLFLMTGPNPGRLNTDFLPVMLSHTPAGTSVRTITHFLQEVNSGEFRQYDYGRLENLAKYWSLSPPAYDLSRVRCPVALFWSHGDWLAPPEDVAHLQALLPNVIHSSAIKEEEFTHLDFVWAVDAKELVYDDVLKLLTSPRP